MTRPRSCWHWPARPLLQNEAGEQLLSRCSGQYRLDLLQVPSVVIDQALDQVLDANLAMLVVDAGLLPILQRQVEEQGECLTAFLAELHHRCRHIARGVIMLT